MEMPACTPGTPSWVGLGTPDLPAAIAFYNGMFGGDIQEGPPEACGYAMAMYQGVPVAGLGPQMNTEIPPSWATYVSIADLEATMALAR